MKLNNAAMIEEIFQSGKDMTTESSISFNPLAFIAVKS
jgi:hypothetical protein